MSLRARLSRRGRQSVHKPIDGTIIGDIDGPTAIVGPKGTLGALDGRWRLEWGAGSEDRWHIAHEETAVRQSRVEDTPVFETSMRIPSGELECRVGAVADGLSRSVMIEFKNDSPGGVALGCVLSIGAVSSATNRSATKRSANNLPGTDLSVDRTNIKADGCVLLESARRAGGVVVCQDEPWLAVAAGPDQPAASMKLDFSNGAENAEAHAAMVFPLPHRASLVLRIAVDGQLSDPKATLAEVAAGWRSITRDAASVDVPDQRLGEAWKRVVPDLVIAAGSTDLLTAAEAAPYLDLAGLHREADRARTALVIATEAGELRGRTASTAISALASRDLRVGEASGLDRLISVLIASAGADIESSALLMAAAAIRLTDSRLGDQLIDLHDARLGSDGESPGIPSTRVAKGAAAVVGHLIGPVGREGTTNIDILPAVPEQWYGQPLDVRGLGTHAGRISFSLRWHGTRPALLWDREGGPDECEITCVGLDPAWSATDRSGEALLSAPGTTAPQPD